MKRLLAILALSAALGCATTTGTDPVELNAEKVISAANSTLETFMKLDDQNFAWLETHAKAVNDTAEALRKPVLVNGTPIPLWVSLVQSATATRRAYKASRSPGNQATLQAAVAALTTAATQASQQLAALNQAIK